MSFTLVVVIFVSRVELEMEMTLKQKGVLIECSMRLFLWSRSSINAVENESAVDVIRCSKDAHNDHI